MIKTTEEYGGNMEENKKDKLESTLERFKDFTKNTVVTKEMVGDLVNYMTDSKEAKDSYEKFIFDFLEKKDSISIKEMLVLIQTSTLGIITLLKIFKDLSNEMSYIAASITKKHIEEYMTECHVSEKFDEHIKEKLKEYMNNLN